MCCAIQIFLLDFLLKKLLNISKIEKDQSFYFALYNLLTMEHWNTFLIFYKIVIFWTDDDLVFKSIKAVSYIWERGWDPE